MRFGDPATERRRRAAARARIRARRLLAQQPRQSSWISVLALALVGVVVLAGVAAAGGVVLFYLQTAKEIGSPGTVIAALADYGGAQIFDRNGTLLYRFPDPNGGIQAPMPLDQISPAIVNATVSTEDATFLRNPGVDVQGIGAAVLRNVQQTGDPFSGAGGSSITQQLVKNTLIPGEERSAHTLTRKATELVYSLKLTQDYPKEQILDWYLNTVNYGGVYDGIESAAEGYFGVHAKELDLAQAAMLAGIPQSPADYSPYSNPEGAKIRQSEVLDLMSRHGYITDAEAAAAKQANLAFHPTQQSLPLHAPWFVEYVRQRLIERFGQHCFDTCGLVVQTTLDLNLEDQAQRILDDNLTKYGDRTGVHNGALLSIDAKTGQVLVMLGSRDYGNDSLVIQGKNNFATAVLQPGSSFKPFVYMTLFMKRGYGPNSVIWDVPYTSDTGYRCENPIPGGRNLGPIPVRLALGSSLNCPANRAADTAGVQNIIDVAHKMGITTLDDPSAYGASIATGGANITLLDMVYAYTTLARNGSMVGDDTVSQPKQGYRNLDPVAFTMVKDGRGVIRYQYQTKSEQVVPPQFPYLVTSIISNCQNRRLIWGCGFPEFVLSDNRPIAAKTGTQAGAKTAQTLANWQFLYTPQLVTGGWVGNGDRTTWGDVNGSANAVGYSVEQLEDYITKTYEIPSADFERPTGVVSVPVHVADGSLGLLGGCGPIEQGLFAEGMQPDVNNRVCKNGTLTVPPEQANTGGLQADGRVCDLVTPTASASTGASPPSRPLCSGGTFSFGGAPAPTTPAAGNRFVPLPAQTPIGLQPGAPQIAISPDQPQIGAPQQVDPNQPLPVLPEVIPPPAAPAAPANAGPGQINLLPVQVPGAAPVYVPPVNQPPVSQPPARSAPLPQGGGNSRPQGSP
ncbi:MAG TPA: transglycosylase domain-containing protein [Dehalococcoidia bacterium]|nr:transglycosylase domain-containing protein [Dehalococcoidia bacterium]